MPAWLAFLVIFVGVRGDHGGVFADALGALFHDEAGVETRQVSRDKLEPLVDFTPRAAAVVEELDVDGVVAASVEDGDVLRIVVFDHDGGLVTLVEQPLTDGKIDAHALVSVIADVKALAPPEPPAPPAPEPVEEVAENPEVDAAPEVATAEEDVPVDADVEEADPRLAIDLDVGIGVAGRRFTPAPATITGYSSTPVPAVLLTGAIRPTDRLSLEVALERAFAMTSHVIDQNVDTAMSRWRATAVYGLREGALGIDGVLGVGRRAFSIEAEEVARTPDSEYGYLELGTRLARRLGRRAVAHGALSFEPVVTGDDGTERMLGPSRRWGLELSAGFEVRLTRRVRLGLGADYQRFTWSWPDAGMRGAGGASDGYASAHAVIGAAY